MAMDLQLHPLENVISVDGWQDYWADGEQFLRVATAAHEQQKKTFKPEALYNLVAMAIEKFIMAYLMKNGDLAENHTMTDLANALERHMGKLVDLREKLEFLDTFQDICDLDTAQYIEPDTQQITKIIAIGKEVQQLISPFIVANLNNSYLN